MSTTKDQEAPQATEREPITQVGTLSADLLELVQRPAVTWRPDKGDARAIAGRVVNVATVVSPYGAYPLFDLDDGVTIWRVHGLGTVLAREVNFRRVGEDQWTTKVAIGDELAVMDTGERIKHRDPGLSPYRAPHVRHRPAAARHQDVAAPAVAPFSDDEIPY